MAGGIGGRRTILVPDGWFASFLSGWLVSSVAGGSIVGEGKKEKKGKKNGSSEKRQTRVSNIDPWG